MPDPGGPRLGESPADGFQGKMMKTDSALYLDKPSTKPPVFHCQQLQGRSDFGSERWWTAQQGSYAHPAYRSIRIWRIWVHGRIGLAFQLIDDWLDFVSSADQLGKTGRLTYSWVWPRAGSLPDSSQNSKTSFSKAVSRAGRCNRGL